MRLDLTRARDGGYVYGETDDLWDAWVAGRRSAEKWEAHDSRIRTEIGCGLDLLAGDYRLKRKPGETDADLRSRIMALDRGVVIED